MDEGTATLIVGIIAWLVTLAMAWIQRNNKKEAEEQGDLIVSHLKESVTIARQFATFVPKVKPIVDAWEKVVADIEKGWNDKAVTTEQLLETKKKGEQLIAEILNAVKG